MINFDAPKTHEQKKEREPESVLTNEVRESFKRRTDYPVFLVRNYSDEIFRIIQKIFREEFIKVGDRGLKHHELISKIMSWDSYRDIQNIIELYILSLRHGDNVEEKQFRISRKYRDQLNYECYYGETFLLIFSIVFDQYQIVSCFNKKRKKSK